MHDHYPNSPDDQSTAYLPAGSGAPYGSDYDDRYDADYAAPSDDAGHRRTAPAAPTGLAARFAVNDMIQDALINAVVIAIGAGIAAFITDLLLDMYLPSQLHYTPVGGAVIALVAFVIFIVICAGFALMLALDGKTNAETMYSMIVWSTGALSLVLLGLVPYGISFTLVVVIILTGFAVAGMLRMPGVIDNHRLAS